MRDHREGFLSLNQSGFFDVIRAIRKMRESGHTEDEIDEAIRQGRETVPRQGTAPDAGEKGATEK